MMSPPGRNESRPRSRDKATAFVADGAERIAHGTGLRLERALFERYRRQMIGCGLLKRLYIRYRIRRHIQHKLRKVLSPYSLYNVAVCSPADFTSMSGMDAPYPVWKREKHVAPASAAGMKSKL